MLNSIWWPKTNSISNWIAILAEPIPKSSAKIGYKMAADQLRLQFRTKRIQLIEMKLVDQFDRQNGSIRSNSN